MTTLLINDKNLVRAFITASNTAVRMTDALAEVCSAWINEQSLEAKNSLEAFNAKIEHNERALKTFKTQLSNAAKKIRKANGIETPAGLTINKDGVLQDGKQRKTSTSAGATGGDGDGDGSAFTETAKPIDREFETHIATLNDMLEASNDVAIRAALKCAIAQLAAKL
jgi:hypothetical protein